MKTFGLMGLVVVMVFGIGSCWAGEVSGGVANARNKGERELVLQSMTITGIVSKAENKKDDGTVTSSVCFVDEAGHLIRVPPGKLEGFVGFKVKVTGQGYVLEKKNKTMRAFKTVTDIEKVEAPVPSESPAK